MICTCTMNPSLDYYLEFEKSVEPDVNNRSTSEHYKAGGKGINISIVLSNLGIPSRALGFLGGFTKDRYIDLLSQYEFLQPNFTYIEGDTRINVKVRDHFMTTTLNAAGPDITPEKLKNLCAKIDRLAEGDYFALAGYCQEYLRPGIIEAMKSAIAEGVRVVLDTNNDIVAAVMENKPFLVKMNVREAGRYLNTSVETEEEILAAAAALHEQGAQNALVIMDDHSKAILVSDEGTFVCPIIREEAPINSIGIGDSIIAGFLMNYVRSSDRKDSFAFGASCGSATVYSMGLGTKEKVEEFYKTAEVTVLG